MGKVVDMNVSNADVASALIKLAVELCERLYSDIRKHANVDPDNSAGALQETLWFLSSVINCQDANNPDLVRDDAVGNVIALEQVMPWMNMVLQEQPQVAEFSPKDKLALATVISLAAKSMQEDLAKDIMKAA